MAAPLDVFERVGETVRATLDVFATVVPDWLSTTAPAAWYDRYRRRVENYLPAQNGRRTDAVRAALAAEIGADGRQLLGAVVDAAADAPWRHAARRARAALARGGRDGRADDDDHLAL